MMTEGRQHMLAQRAFGILVQQVCRIDSEPV